MNETMSAAMRRYNRYPQSPEWFCDFRYHDVGGLSAEEGVHRRDPSSVINVDGTFHVWYTKSTGVAEGFAAGDDAKVFPWDRSEVWHATSADGLTWIETDRALGAGEPGSYDDRSVFTPEVLHHEGRFYLVYQVVASPYRLRSTESIAIACADDPAGPWTRSPHPILRPAEGGEWIGDEDNHLQVVRTGPFDSLKVHDPLLLPFEGRFHLYYKGEQMAEKFAGGGRATRWGVAIADAPEGPYERSPLNPITNSGHETCLWLHADGVAALLTTDGPERNTVQFARDGQNFEIMAYLADPPVAAGPFREERPTVRGLDGLRWGLCHDVTGPWHYIRGFAADERRKDLYAAGSPPELADLSSPPPGAPGAATA
ncbi:glycoside hydrolase family 117 protein [Demequina maris]|uniref:glycoside hydrolase family 117 protein n=1 Tax=Demequina maris TaxID=1638982 RepID=UPI000AD9621B|nr:glycosyl hydrolase [Demequina maris]